MMLLCAILMVGDPGPGTVPAENIRLAVQRYVAERMSKGNVEYVLEIRSIPSAMASDPSICTVQVAREASITLKGISTIPVDIVCSGRVEQRVLVPVRVRTFDNVLMTRRQLRRHEPVTSADVIFERIETTSIDETALRNPNDLAARRTTRILPARSILTRNQLEIIPAVNQDDIVTVSVRTRTTSVSLRGIAKEDGTIGATITVQPEGRHDRVRARVVDKGIVELDLDAVAVKQ
jgi:flagella basal body P-ring formation protein FlgA